MPWIFLTDADLQFDLARARAASSRSPAGADLLVGRRVQRQDPLVAAR